VLDPSNGSSFSAEIVELETTRAERRASTCNGNVKFRFWLAYGLRRFTGEERRMSVKNRALKMGRSVSSRKVVTYRSGHFTGYVPSVKNERMIQYESILERDYIQLIETDREIISYSEQPVPLKWSDGIDHFVTTFDFKVERDGGREYLVEVKPLARVIKYRLDELYGYARAAAKAEGYDDFELWTDRELKALPRLPNAELLTSSKTTFEDQGAELAIQSAVSAIGKKSRHTTIRELRSVSKLGSRAYWSVIKMVARGELVPVDPAAPLDDNAIMLISGN
jgi:hypothetical protein